MELILTWVIKAEHTGVGGSGGGGTWGIQVEPTGILTKNCTGTRHPVVQKEYFIPTYVSNLINLSYQSNQIYLHELIKLVCLITLIGIQVLELTNLS